MNERVSKAIRTAIVFDNYFNLPMKAGLLVDPIKITFLRKILSEYLHEFNFDDIHLVKEECCADEGNTYCVCSNQIFGFASILIEENSLFEAYSP